MNGSQSAETFTSIDLLARLDNGWRHTPQLTRVVEYALDVLQRVDAGGNVLWQAKIMQDSSTATAPHRAVPVASLYEYRKP